MIDFIDLLSLLRMKNKSLKGVEIYGMTTKVLDRPESLASSVSISPNCICVQVDILAVNLSRYANDLKAFNIYNNDNIYLVRGSMACYIDKNIKLPDWYAFKGNLNIGSKDFTPFVTMFNFAKEGNNWSISATPTSDIDINSWDRESNRAFKYLGLSLVDGKIVLPVEMSTLSSCCAEWHQEQKLSVPQSNPQLGMSSGVPLDMSLSSAMNGVSQEIVHKPESFTIVDRTEILPKSAKFTELNSLLSATTLSKKEYINKLKDAYSMNYDEVSDQIKYLFSNLNRYFKSKQTSVGSTGRAIVKSYIDTEEELAEKEYLGSTTGAYALSIFSEIASFVINGTMISADKSALNLIKVLFYEPELAYAGLLGKIVGIQDLRNVAETCLAEGISFSRLISKNPYALLLISNQMSFKDVEMLAHCLGKTSDSSIVSERNIGILYDYSNNSENGHTCYEYSKLKNLGLGLSLTNAKYTVVKATGTYLTGNIKANLTTFINGDLNDKYWQYPTSGWIRQNRDMCLPLSTVELDKAIKDFILSGLGVDFKVKGKLWITSSKLLAKEIFVYNKIYELSSKKLGYDHKRIDFLIDEFERLKGFKLEAKQRDSVHLIDNCVAIVTGPAGSGKTTVSECIVYVLEHYDEDVATPSIQFGAPTGKAAKRLQEVVGGSVRTMNSMFCVGVSSDSAFEDDSSDESGDLAISLTDIYIFDENAMATLDLIYLVLKRVANPRIYFLGDIKQLPPIGKGLPFKNFLRFVACVRLTVSKRSAENSGITYNSSILNDFSEPYNWKPLVNMSDFKLCVCRDDLISRTCSLLCKYYLKTILPDEIPLLLRYTGINSVDDLIKIDNLTPDDIQVVTPIGKATYEWGTYQVNLTLQPLFNTDRTKDSSFTYKSSSAAKGTEFKVGDRVIHCKNMYTVQWYSTWKDGIFTKVWGNGIMNGDVGKVVGFVPADGSEFLDQETERPDEYKDKRKLRKDANWRGNDKYFVVVEYYDVNQDLTYYILYQSVLSDPYGNKNAKIFTGLDLSSIQLFYAGTTHKMQGSQAKLVIVLLGTVSFRNFITRNLLYTSVTRASDGVYMLGNVSNDRTSQLSIARQDIADEGTDTVGELLCD